jgi:hypothetical protein
VLTAVRQQSGPAFGTVVAELALAQGMGCTGRQPRFAQNDMLLCSSGKAPFGIASIVEALGKLYAVTSG